MSAVVCLAIAVLAYTLNMDWLLWTMVVLAVVLPPKWNPAFWHRVEPGTGRIRPGGDL